MIWRHTGASPIRNKIFLLAFRPVGPISMSLRIHLNLPHLWNIHGGICISGASVSTAVSTETAEMQFQLNRFFRVHFLCGKLDIFPGDSLRFLSLSLQGQNSLLKKFFPSYWMHIQQFLIVVVTGMFGTNFL